MESYDEENNYPEVIDNLMIMFGNVMSKDVISAVVESCDGDLNVAMDAIMNITNDGNVISKKEDEADEKTETANQPVESPQTTQPSISYASAAYSAQPIQNTGAIPKHIQRPTTQASIVWTNQIREIITDHNQGNRTLIIMRGAPGSGKSYLAKQLVDMMIGVSFANYKTHILSTDDYFMVRGQYQYEKYKLPEAHMWNQKRACDALKAGLSPVIVDNTNIEMWEMEPYVRNGVQNGYIIQVVEPTTPWAKKPNQLVRKNTHNVPLYTIKRIVDNYCNNITGEILKQAYGLSYPADMVPPVKRKSPPIPEAEPPVSNPVETKHSTTTAINMNTPVTTQNDSHNELFLAPPVTLNIQTQLPINNIESKNEINENTSEPEQSVENDEDDEMTLEEAQKLKKFLEAQKRLEEIEKVEREWENGEHWDEDNLAAGNLLNDTAAATKTPVNFQNIVSVSECKPQRKPQSELSTVNESSESLMQSVNRCQDWSRISMFMPPWVDSSETSGSIANQEVPVEKISSGTCMEIGDTDVYGKNKVVTATPRNINEFHLSFQREKIPEKRMFDKSSMTNETTFVTETFRCSNEEKHFIAFRKLFKNIARSDLRDIFDKCCGDVNWAVEIVLDGMSNNQFKTVDVEDLSDPEEECSEQCECLANYNIIPDATKADAAQFPLTKESEEEKQRSSVAVGGAQSQKKKRDATMSDESIQMKRQIEQNVVIADNHYSKHCLKIRKLRRGEPDLGDEVDKDTSNLGASVDASACESNTSPDLEASDDESDSLSDYNVSVNGDDVMVTVNLGRDFLAELDVKFGRIEMEYPGYIQPKISMPLSLLNEINALWMESVADQLDEHAERTAAMMQQDEEFARQLAMKEQELSLAGKEPEVPDFKEIMDMDLALALYQKDVAEWRNNMPTDMAAKMSRDKLFNLFPDVDKDTLTELLMAHDNNFKSTVEVLLMSTGRSEILETENGVNKFIVEKELLRKDEILEEKRKELSEEEWPLLSKDQKVDMSTVEAFRKEADQHLARRNQNYQKAQDCVRRGMTQVANYYSEIANFHKQKYEHANSMAVASLMQFHALNSPDCTTIDLHYLRVKEAKESLDIFIDTHISKLRETGNRQNLTLFFITGRGQHSRGRARIKPATISRLRERGLGYTFRNPGLLSAKVNYDTKLTYLLP